MTSGARNIYITLCPFYSLWFERFNVGIHKQTGCVVYQDKDVTLDVIHKLVEDLNVYYLEGENDR